jgi:DNA-binding response OmpR family regulator
MITFEIIFNFILSVLAVCNPVEVCLKTAKILIVDDDDLYRQTLEGQLAAMGYQATGAPDGNSGGDILRSEQFSLLLLDLRLPDTDGLSLLKQWKELNFSGIVPLLLICLRK